MSTMKLPMAAVPAAIAESVAITLKAHGLSLSFELLRELGNNTAQALVAIDSLTMCDAEEPPPAQRLAVGETLRALALARVPNPETAATLDQVGEWLTEVAQFEIALERSRDGAVVMADARTEAVA